MNWINFIQMSNLAFAYYMIFSNLQYLSFHKIYQTFYCKNEYI